MKKIDANSEIVGNIRLAVEKVGGNVSKLSREFESTFGVKLGREQIHVWLNGKHSPSALKYHLILKFIGKIK